MSKPEKELAVSIQVPGPDRTVAAFPGLVVAGELDDLQDMPLEVSMTDDWLAYFNLRVMTEAGRLMVGRINYVLLVPDPVAGQVMILQAKDKDQYGATEVKYVETENGAWINLRLAMKQLGVSRQKDRVRIFPVTFRPGADDKKYLALSIKEGVSRPVQKRDPDATPTDDKASTTGDKKKK